jgi:hypothetical protein
VEFCGQEAHRYSGVVYLVLLLLLLFRTDRLAYAVLAA